MHRGKWKVQLIRMLLVIIVLASCGGDDNKKKQGSGTPAEGTLTTTSAQVDYRASGSEDWQPVAKTQLVGGKDAIRTDATGRGLLTFYTGTEVELLPGAEVVVTQLEKTAEGGYIVVLTQSGGETEHNVTLAANTNSSYEIDTPSANLVVRGTEFGVEVAPDGATTVEVRKGVVQATAGKQTVEVKAGEALDIRPDQTIPGTPYPIPVIRPPDATPTPSGQGSN